MSMFTVLRWSLTKTVQTQTLVIYSAVWRAAVTADVLNMIQCLMSLEIDGLVWHTKPEILW